MKSRLRIILISIFTLLFVPLTAFAHKPSDSYLNIQVDDGNLTGRWDIALRDLEVPLGLDRDLDGNLTWGEVVERKSDIFQYALSRLTVSTTADNDALEPGALLLENHSDGVYAVLNFTGRAIDSKPLVLSYALFFDFDLSHRGIATIRIDENTASTVLSPDERVVSYDFSQKSSAGFLSALIPFVKSGIWHILIGFDHVLFLLTLILPAALVWKGRDSGWQPATDLREASFDVVKVVTSFTIAHSITLALTVLGTINFPSRLVESVIALSVALSAINNIYPLVAKSRWGIAFIFGLVHGCGFASVLVDAGLPTENFLAALFGFNLGVELGQLLIVMSVLPLLYLLRSSSLYRGIGLHAGSIAASGIALIWVVERLFDLSIF